MRFVINGSVCEVQRLKKMSRQAVASTSRPHALAGGKGTDSHTSSIDQGDCVMNDAHTERAGLLLCRGSCE